MADTCKECKYLTQRNGKDCCLNADSDYRGYAVSRNIAACDKFESKAKPPLGVKPSCLTAESRISDLAEAILRYTEGGCTKHGYEQIKTFAKEIYLQSDLALQMEG